MTSTCEIKFDNISIAEQKETVPDDFIYLFQESDRRVIQHADLQPSAAAGVPTLCL